MTFLFGLIIGAIILVTVTALFLDSPLSAALAKRISRSAPPPDARLEAMQAEIDALNASVSRLEEESDFVRTLLEDSVSKAGPGALPPGGRA